MKLHELLPMLQGCFRDTAARESTTLLSVTQETHRVTRLGGVIFGLLVVVPFLG